ncbi:MAG TPA: FG-GAP-like repeat-containing protein [Candidatus Deferrimicrobium sp.]|nr:FG-GAP-like repeat-containing protein [Candidatus Deferrimicrobium sp.]
MGKGLVFVVVAALAASAAAQLDPGVPDTIRFECDTLRLGQSVPVKLYVFNDEAIGVFDVAFFLEPSPDGFASVDSIVYVGRMTDPQTLDFRISPAQIRDGIAPDTVGIAALKFYGDNLPAGAGYLAEIYVTGQTLGTMVIRKGGYPPVIRNIFLLPEDHSQFAPQVVDDTALIVPGTSGPTIAASVSLYRGVSGTPVRFQVDASSPNGLPFSVGIKDMVGFDDESLHPVQMPTVTQSPPYEFNWYPTIDDAGVWTATLEACDTMGRCATTRVDIQIVQSLRYLLSFDLHITDSVPAPLAVAPGNFDQDQQPELLIAGIKEKGRAPLVVLELGVGGQVRQEYAFGDGEFFKSGQVGFCDSDNSLDLVLQGHSVWDRLITFRGLGDATFAYAAGDELSGTSRGSVLLEFTGDDVLDFATIWHDGIRLFIGAGDLNYLGFSDAIPARDSALSINSADFNEDGLDDLAVGTRSGLEIYLADGSDYFIGPAVYPQAFGSLDIEVTNEGTDFNGDNHFDLCVATPSQAGTHSEIMIYLGNGDGSFEQRRVRLVKGHVLSNCVGDFNGDTQLDVAWINGSYKYVAVMFGDGVGDFPNELRYLTPTYTPRRVTSLDIGVDGDLDIAVCSFNRYIGTSLLTYENRLDPTGFQTANCDVSVVGNAQVQVTSPSGREINKIKNSMSAAAFYRKNIDQNGLLDEFITIAAIEDQAYHITVKPKPGLPVTSPFGVETEVDGRIFRLARNATMRPEGYRFEIYPTTTSPVTPVAGAFVEDNPPTFTWPGTGSFEFELASDIEFRNPLIRTQVTGNSFTPAAKLPVADTAIFFWHVRQVGSTEFSSLNPVNLVPPSPTDVPEDHAEVPGEFYLMQNYPNPFNPSTMIVFGLPHRSRVRIEIYDLLGRTVRTLMEGIRPAGHYEIPWDGLSSDGQTLSSGIYFYRLKADDYTISKKLMLLR